MNRETFPLHPLVSGPAWYLPRSERELPREAFPRPEPPHAVRRAVPPSNELKPKELPWKSNIATT